MSVNSFIRFVFNNVYVCGYVYLSTHGMEVRRDVGSSGTGVTAVINRPAWLLGTELGASARTERQLLSHLSIPSPLTLLHRARKVGEDG